MPVMRRYATLYKFIQNICKLMHQDAESGVRRRCDVAVRGAPSVGFSSWVGRCLQVGDTVRRGECVGCVCGGGRGGDRHDAGAGEGREVEGAAARRVIGYGEGKEWGEIAKRLSRHEREADVVMGIWGAG